MSADLHPLGVSTCEPLPDHDAPSDPDPSPDRDAASIASVLAMIEPLDPLALAELERALRLKLKPAATAAERRVAELGFLAKLLGEQPPSEAPVVSRSIYDERRAREAPEAPDSRRLVEKYGRWTRVCRAASSIRPDGRITGTTIPFSNHTRERRRVRTYERAEVTSAIRRCALELGRIPSSGVYQHWTFDVKRAAREAGLEMPRVPGINTVYRFYKPWARAVAAAGVTAAEVARGRVERVLRLARIDALPAEPLEAFRACDPAALAEIGIDPARRTYLTKNGLAQLPLSDALKVCQLLGGNLDWLGGIESPLGEPPEGSLVFNPNAIDTLLDEGKIDVTELHRRLERAVGPWRRLRNGKREPLLYELAVIAHAGKQPIVALLKTR